MKISDGRNSLSNQKWKFQKYFHYVCFQVCRNFHQSFKLPRNTKVNAIPINYWKINLDPMGYQAKIASKISIKE